MGGKTIMAIPHKPTIARSSQTAPFGLSVRRLRGSGYSYRSSCSNCFSTPDDAKTEAGSLGALRPVSSLRESCILAKRQLDPSDLAFAMQGAVFSLGIVDGRRRVNVYIS